MTDESDATDDHRSDLRLDYNALLVLALAIVAQSLGVFSFEITQTMIGALTVLALVVVLFTR